MRTFRGQGYIDFEEPAAAPAQRHSPTSVAAAARQTPEKLAGDKAIVFETLQAHGPLTDEGIAERSGLPINTARPRRLDLQKLGYVVQHDAEGRTSTGSRATRWRIA